MTLRRPIFVDVTRIVDLLEQMVPESIYAGRASVCRDTARRVIANAIQRHGGTHDGGTFIMVEDDDEGIIQGFIIGILSRVYLIGNKLEATDLFLHLTELAPRGAMDRLIDAYLGWADANPLVLDVHLSWSDALPSGIRMTNIYRRKGFRMSGGRFTRPRRASATAVGEAA